jgi:hypothetical protein
MEKKYNLSLDLKEDQSVIMDITVAKSGSQLITEAKVSYRVRDTNMYTRTGSDFNKKCLTTEVKRYSQKALQVHLDWISANKDTVVQEALASCGLKAVA